MSSSSKEVIIPQKIGLQLTCRYCGHSWIYGGRREYYATCPNCRNCVKLRREVKKG